MELEQLKIKRAAAQERLERARLLVSELDNKIFKIENGLRLEALAVLEKDAKFRALVDAEMKRIAGERASKPVGKRGRPAKVKA